MKGTYLLIYLIAISLLGSCQLANSNTKETVLEPSIPESIDTLLVQGKWVSNLGHSSIQFRTRHAGVYDMIGWFEDFQITVVVEDKDFTKATIEAVIKPESIRMPNPMMANNTTKRESLFYVEKYPEVVFNGKRMEKVGDNIYKLTGDFTIKEVTRELVLDIQFNGFGRPMLRGMPGFTITGQFSLYEMSMGKEPPPPDKNPMVGDAVYITANLRMDYAGK